MIPSRQHAFPSASGWAEEQEGTAERTTRSTPVNWLGAVGLGLGTAVGAAMAWAVIAAITGYVFGIAAVFIGIVIAYAVAKGAKHITVMVIGLFIALTFLAIVLGDILGLTLTLVWAGYDVTLLNVLAHYPEIVSFAPGEAFVVYLFGILGAFAGARRLSRLMKAQTEAAASPWSRTEAATPVITAQTAKTEVFEQATTGARARLMVPMSPPHSVEATFQGASRHASVRLDAGAFWNADLSENEKIVQVPLEGAPSHMLNIRFWNADRPRIDFRLDGVLIGEV